MCPLLADVRVMCSLRVPVPLLSACPIRSITVSYIPAGLDMWQYNPSVTSVFTLAATTQSTVTCSPAHILHTCWSCPACMVADARA